MMRRQPQVNGTSVLHTPAKGGGGEERERDGANSMNGDYEAMIDKGQWMEFSQDTGVTPLHFARCAMGFLMTT